jgi:molybdenum-dependent DNA-binding transcriptional regulator ModE
MAETQVSICIDLETGGRIGQGEIALLEAIRETGSTTAAGIAMKCLIAERGYNFIVREG